MIQPLKNQNPTQLQKEVAKRRTFAIISHPDAGKTTLTEKLLLYSNAVDLAGAVRGRKSQRHATSDWMSIEQERGISITSTVLQFQYNNCYVNLLDTPGHQDFSEDTYRTLMAVDSAVMVLDAAKGIEAQTKKLFEVCRMRHIPILTFINKMDHVAREPLQLLDEIEKILGIPAVAINWPIGDGPTFQGVYDLQKDQVLRFNRTEHGQRKAPVTVSDVDDLALLQLLGKEAHSALREDVELLSIAGTSFDEKQYLAGDMTPVYFGSALNNFGVEPFLDALIQLAPPPQPRQLVDGDLAIPEQEDFSGFVFKIQANMNPKHRDSIAFMRICSGRFQKDMVVSHPRLGRNVRLTRPYQLFAQGRSSLEEAFPGDVLGLANPGLFTIGDSLSTGKLASFLPLPSFEPEFFALIRNKDTAKHKQFHKGIEQLVKEGAIQRLFALDDSQIHPLLAAVGKLQFEVVEARLKTEYNVEVEIEYLPYTGARRINADLQELAKISWPSGVMEVKDGNNQTVALFSSEWEIRRCIDKYPNITFQEFGFGVNNTWENKGDRNRPNR